MPSAPMNGRRTFLPLLLTRLTAPSHRRQWAHGIVSLLRTSRIETLVALVLLDDRLHRVSTIADCQLQFPDAHLASDTSRRSRHVAM